MRKKENRLIVTFHTTIEAMEVEQFCKQRGIVGRLIPLPTQIHAGCGLAWSAPIGDMWLVKQAFEQEKLSLEGYYQIEI